MMCSLYYWAHLADNLSRIFEIANYNYISGCLHLSGNGLFLTKADTNGTNQCEDSYSSSCVSKGTNNLSIFGRYQADVRQ